MQQKVRCYSQFHYQPCSDDTEEKKLICVCVCVCKGHRISHRIETLHLNNNETEQSSITVTNVESRDLATKPISFFKFIVNQILEMQYPKAEAFASPVHLLPYSPASVPFAPFSITHTLTYTHTALQQLRNYQSVTVRF